MGLSDSRREVACLGGRSSRSSFRSPLLLLSRREERLMAPPPRCALD